MPLAKGVIKDKDGQYTILTQFTITSKAEGDTFREIGQKLTFRARDYNPQYYRLHRAVLNAFLKNQFSEKEWVRVNTRLQRAGTLPEWVGMNKLSGK